MLKRFASLLFVLALSAGATSVQLSDLTRLMLSVAARHAITKLA